MKKFIIIAAAAIVAFVSVTFAANSLSNMTDHSKCDSFKCSSCNGTGWTGQIRCYMCKGTGANGSY